MRKRLFSIISIGLVLVMLLSCTSCSLHIRASELSEGYTRNATESGEVTNDFKTKMTEFSLTFFQKLVTKDDDNDLVSPISAVICLAMLANGTDGNTKAQIESTFNMDIETLNKCLYAFTSSLYTSDDCKINIADSIWFRDEENRLHVNESFLQDNADWYNAQIFAAPFNETTKNDINKWCDKHTDGMIKEIIDEIDGSDVMYLINALTFDAKWDLKYEKDAVKEGQFTNYDGEKATVQMLSSEETTYLSDDGVKGFSKDYSGKTYSIIALLPDEGTDIYDYIDSLDGAAWRSLLNSRTMGSVTVKMPEFSYSTDLELNETLQAMGITDIFNSHADFSKLGYSENGKLICSSVNQKTFIQVDRNGTKASAASWAEMKDGAANPTEIKEVILDRPFVFAIIDNTSELPLFLGAVTNLD